MIIFKNFSEMNFPTVGGFNEENFDKHFRRIFIVSISKFYKSIISILQKFFVPIRFLLTIFYYLFAVDNFIKIFFKKREMQYLILFVHFLINIKEW